MKTSIYTSRKLEKLVKKLIQTELIEDSGILGKWNATVFYVNRKKYWLVTNAKTAYNVILEDVQAADLPDIEEIFKEAFYNQLLVDQIHVELEELDKIIGELHFFRTNNDRRTTGFQNQRLYEADLWIERSPGMKEEMIERFMANMNGVPIRLDKSSKYTLAHIAMKNALGV